jgi:hypothetical protein
MFPAGFKPAIPASEHSQTHVLDRAATGIGAEPDGLKIKNLHFTVNYAADTASFKL